VAPPILALHLHALHLHHHLHGRKVDYIGVALAAFLSWAGVSGPGEAALIAAGIAASRGRVDIAGAIAFAWAGATAGGVVGWLVGRHGGRRAILAGRWLRRPRERALDHGNRFFERFGWVAVYFAPSWAAGINGMRARLYIPANAVCALVWSLLIGLGSYVLGPSIRDVASDVGLAGAAAIVVGVPIAALLARRGIRHRRRPRARGGAS
jgi:membrane-associated protein